LGRPIKVLKEGRKKFKECGGKRGNRGGSARPRKKGGDAHKEIEKNT